MEVKSFDYQIKVKKAKLLLLTNPNNDSPEEDIFLAEYLKDFFQVTVCHPKDCQQFEDKCDLILIRNIWSTRDYKVILKNLFKRLKEKGIGTYNSLDGSGDMAEKGYLVDLFKGKFPVIPTIDKLEDLALLGDSKNYILKPVDGGSSIGIRKVNAVVKENFKGHVVQPFIDIQYEISFYFIDKEFIFALRTEKDRWDLVPYRPSKNELMIAERFVNWNKLSYGIQRVDFCKTKDGQILLMEIEDFCPYLSLLDLPEDIRKVFLQKFLEALSVRIPSL